MSKHTDFIFGVQVDRIASPSRLQTVPKRGVVTSRDKFEILGAPSISQEWLKLELSIFFTKGDYIKSCKKDDKSPLKGAWFFSRDPFRLRNCGFRKNFAAARC